MQLLYRARVPAPFQRIIFYSLTKIGIFVHLRDTELANLFQTERDRFERLRCMLSTDSHLGYISGDKMRVTEETEWRGEENPAITAERWNEYRQLLEQLGIFASSHVGDTMTFRMSTFGSASKGIVFSPAHRVVVQSLESYPMPPERHAHIVLDDPWHIYYGWDN